MDNIGTRSVSRLPERFRSRLRLPVIAAPMLHVSGPDLVVAACRAGVIGAFPTLNPTLMRAEGGLDGWLTGMKAQLGSRLGACAPICPNLVMRSPDVGQQVETIIRHGIEMVITSVGSPKPVMPHLKAANIFVLADVATLDHARKAIEAGVDGLVLLTAGAGGQTGWLNPFAYVRAVREIFDGPIVLAGGISDGVALRAAEVLGCDLAYMGTKFIATRESLATDAYRDMLVRSSLDDVVLTKAFTGLSASFLRPSIIAEGLDPDRLDESISAAEARQTYSAGASGPRRWTGVKSAGHSVSGVKSIQTVAELVEQTARDYQAAHG